MFVAVAHKLDDRSIHCILLNITKESQCTMSKPSTFTVLLYKLIRSHEPKARRRSDFAWCIVVAMFAAQSLNSFVSLSLVYARCVQIITPQNQRLCMQQARHAYQNTHSHQLHGDYYGQKDRALALTYQLETAYVIQ